METTTDFLAGRYGALTHAGLRMTKADFLRWKSDDNYVYEYNDGLLEPTTSTKQDEVILLKRLTRCFNKTDAYKQEGELVGEIDVWLTEKQMRRPDVTNFSGPQLQRMAAGDDEIPAFVVEFSSEYDDVRKDLKKAA